MNRGSRAGRQKAKVYAAFCFKSVQTACRRIEPTFQLACGNEASSASSELPNLHYGFCHLPQICVLDVADGLFIVHWVFLPWAGIVSAGSGEASSLSPSARSAGPTAGVVDLGLRLSAKKKLQAGTDHRRYLPELASNPNPIRQHHLVWVLLYHL